MLHYSYKANKMVIAVAMETFRQKHSASGKTHSLITAAHAESLHLLCNQLWSWE